MEKQILNLDSEFFTLAEFVKSSTAEKNKINNDPDAEVIKNLQYGVDMVLDPLRRLAGMPIIITSGYRCQRLNKLVGGVPNSWHKIGCAADIRVNNEKDALYKFNLLKSIPSVDTCLFEHSKSCCWLHVQWSRTKSPRHHFNFNHVAL